MPRPSPIAVTEATSHFPCIYLQVFSTFQFIHTPRPLVSFHLQAGNVWCVQT